MTDRIVRVRRVQWGDPEARYEAVPGINLAPPQKSRVALLSVALCVMIAFSIAIIAYRLWFE
ncbi:hypothetical protein [Paradevosia shaoguanensis]|jgi:hypothetical protein|uniref:Uncharacterized protein n=1 Tax=Paradevosia shaoguanensis TaxID=1335043 RepID=A0AA41QM69_9HYPH|nr:hypothetical protein [Paradevosia shaoguanensis]KFL24764.1 hypothetical protein JP74_23315 [Devosia sp. 17-2-E-8]MBI4047454.1 hypothetical protein [Devosia nanyangense]QMV02043.1 hypothetical protein GHV40_11400 [Devosia sp. D6-9]CDP50473.1 hypothetical protein [Devosia sp. DBB001]MCF1742587.1 hypothetical protein [Paradevosia shaoguanensis]